MPSTYLREKDIVYKFFGSIKELDCPAFPQEKIYFTSKGANHVFYRSKNTRRSKRDRQIRISLLSRAVEVLKIMPIFQEYQITSDGRTQYWAFEGVIEEKRIKIIVRQVGNGRKHFWSVVPGWRRSKNGKIRLNFKRDLNKV